MLRESADIIRENKVNFIDGIISYCMEKLCSVMASYGPNKFKVWARLKNIIKKV